MSTPPPPQLLNKDFLRKCSEIVSGGGWINEIAKELGVPYKTIYSWYIRDVQNFCGKMTSWRHKGMVEKANRILEETLDMDTRSPIFFFGKEIGVQVNPKLVKTKVDNAQFVLGMLSSDFKKKREVSGANGAPIIVRVVNYSDPVQTDLEAAEEDF